ncbi:MAG: hypothetical protein K5901_06545 [Bacteroidales bacterium]|nr:hypothetical protein [Bacteroidales bacterium]
MKNTATIIAALALGLFMLVGCKSDQALIEDAAMGYLTAMGNYKIKEAEVYASEETIEKTLHVIEESIMPNLDSNFIKQNTPATIVIQEVNLLTDTTAEVKYVKTTPIQVQEGKLDMVKRDKEWKAQVQIQLPAIFNSTHEVDTKAMEDKFKGKLKVSKPGEAPPKRRIDNLPDSASSSN